MPRAKIGKRYLIVKSFRDFPKKDYVENYLSIENNTMALAYSEDRLPISLELLKAMPRLANQLPKVIKRGNDLMFPIPDENQVVRLRHKIIFGVFQYRNKIYALTA